MIIAFKHNFADIMKRTLVNIHINNVFILLFYGRYINLWRKKPMALEKFFHPLGLLRHLGFLINTPGLDGHCVQHFLLKHGKGVFNMNIPDPEKRSQFKEEHHTACCLYRIRDMDEFKKLGFC